jgi:hypothetical protein
MAYKKVRRDSGYKVTPTHIFLVCRCGIECVIERTTEDTGEDLDRSAKGWLTLLIGAAMCPKCVREKQPHTGSFGVIHGKPKDDPRNVWQEVEA